MPEGKGEDIYKKLLPQSTQEIRRALYIEKRIALKDRIVLAASLGLTPKNILIKVWKQLKNIQEPQFPIKGRDLLKIEKVQEGPELGKLMGKVERWWMDRNFLDSREKCIEQAEKIIKNANANTNGNANANANTNANNNISGKGET